MADQAEQLEALRAKLMEWYDLMKSEYPMDGPESVRVAYFKKIAACPLYLLLCEANSIRAFAWEYPDLLEAVRAGLTTASSTESDTPSTETDTPSTETDTPSTETDTPSILVSVGSGNGMVEAALQRSLCTQTEELLSVICVDPRGDSICVPPETANMSELMEFAAFGCCVWDKDMGSGGLRSLSSVELRNRLASPQSYLSPQFATVEKLREVTDVDISNCMLLLHWPEPTSRGEGGPGHYDFDAIKTLQPAAIVAFFETLGGAGGVEFHAFMRKVGVPAVQVEFYERLYPWYYEDGEDAIARRKVVATLASQYEVVFCRQTPETLEAPVFGPECQHTIVALRRIAE